jgi:hypothetical protein
MGIAAVLRPLADWHPVLEGARAADQAGLAAIGLYDQLPLGATRVAVGLRF